MFSTLARIFQTLFPIKISHRGRFTFCLLFLGIFLFTLFPTIASSALVIASAKTQNSPTCPAGSSFNSALNECTAPATCPPGLSLSADGFCEGAPSCPAGTSYVLTAGDCQASSCPSGTTFNSSNQDCEVAATCPSGTSFSYNNQYLDWGCVSSPPMCPSGLTYDSTLGMCTTPAYTYCPSGTGFAPQVGCITDLQCPSGTSLVTGSSCGVPVTCPQFTSAQGIDGTYYCTSGLTSQSCGFPTSGIALLPGVSISYDGAAGKCDMPVCQSTNPTSSFNPALFSNDNCYMTPACYGNVAGAYVNATGDCEVPPNCPLGSTYQEDTLLPVTTSSYYYICYGGSAAFDSNPPCPAPYTDFLGSCISDPCSSLSALFPSDTGTYPTTLWNNPGPSGCYFPPGYTEPGYDSNHLGTDPTVYLLSACDDCTDQTLASLSTGSDNHLYYTYENNCQQYSSLRGEHKGQIFNGGTWMLTLLGVSDYVCESSPACPAGTSSQSFLIGAEIYQFCVASPTCPTGTLYGSSCITGTSSCPSGTSETYSTVLSETVCEAPVNCPSGSSFDGYFNCTGADCPGYYTPGGSCTGVPNCPSNTSLENVLVPSAVCVASVSCPSGTTLTSGLCVGPRNSCPSGSIFINSHSFSGCRGSPTCPSGTTYSAPNFLCVAGSIIPTPVFPLGSILGAMVPLGALLVYFYARRSKTAPGSLYRTDRALNIRPSLFTDRV